MDPLASFLFNFLLFSSLALKLSAPFVEAESLLAVGKRDGRFHARVALEVQLFVLSLVSFVGIIG